MASSTCKARPTTDCNTSEEARGAETTQLASPSSATAADVGRSLIVDEAFFEEQFLRCQVCHDRFDQGDRAPKSLPCNHTFCLPCMTQIFDHAQPPNRRTLLWANETLDGALKCPTCRVEIFLSRNKIKELPNDHRVVQMMDFLSQAVAKSQNACSKHERQPLNFFCKKCLTPVCRDCTVLDHKDSEGHNIIDVSEALSENSTQFSDIEKQSRETLEKMKARSDSLANASKRLDILDRRLKNEIKETFIEYRLLLEKRQEALTSMVHKIVKDQKGMINSIFVNVCEHGTQLQKLYDEFKASRHNNDIRQLFAITQKMRDQENQFAEVASKDDNALFQSCEFETLNEGTFLSDLSGLGEVRKKSDPELKDAVSHRQLVYLDVEEQRERQRYIDNQVMNFEDFMPAIHDNELMPTFTNEDDDEEEELSRGNLQYDNRVSRLISQYMTEMGGLDEDLDHDEVLPSAIRRNIQERRGRRPRDTNSTQVHSSIAMEPQGHLSRPVRVAAGERGSSSGSAIGSHRRTGIFNRLLGTISDVRVIRHQDRHQDNMTADDSN